MIGKEQQDENMLEQENKAIDYSWFSLPYADKTLIITTTKERNKGNYKIQPK